MGIMQEIRCLPVVDKDESEARLKTLNINGGTSFRTCIGEIRSIRDYIESQPNQKIYVFVPDADTFAAYDYSVIRNGEKYKGRIEVPYLMATNNANLIHIPKKRFSVSIFSESL